MAFDKETKAHIRARDNLRALQGMSAEDIARSFDPTTAIELYRSALQLPEGLHDKDSRANMLALEEALGIVGRECTRYFEVRDTSKLLRRDRGRGCVEWYNPYIRYKIRALGFISSFSLLKTQKFK